MSYLGNRPTNVPIQSGDMVEEIANPEAGSYGQNIQVRGDGQGYELAGPLQGFKNWIINGDFRINQRGASTKAQSSGTYGYDRWKGTQNQGSNTDTLVQLIESLPAGEYTLSWKGGGDGRVQDITGSTYLSSATTSPITFTLSTDDAKVGVYVPATATEVQVERGPVATPFEHRPVGVELALCQRYYAVTKGFAQTRGCDRVATPLMWPTVMRATPTVTHDNDGDTQNVSTFIIDRLSEYGGRFYVATTVGAYTDAIVLNNRTVRADAEL